MHATLDYPASESGDGTYVVSTAPVALWTDDPESVFKTAVHTAALSHSAPEDYLAAGLLAVMIQQLLRGEELERSAWQARVQLVRWPGHEESLRLLDGAHFLAKFRDLLVPEQLDKAFGRTRNGS